MEQTTVKMGRRSGWSNQEAELLWETADEAQQQGVPLKQVFEQIARQTGRRPNSIRNYYYAQVRERFGDQQRTARFVPFTEDEVARLMEQVIRARAEGHSVRSCLQQMAQGDHSLMLRYQNKYRSVLKSRPELVNDIVEKLNREGVDCAPPEVVHRPRATLKEACEQLTGSAQQAGDAELVRACETISRLMLTSGGRGGVRDMQSVIERDRLSVRCDLLRLALSERQQALSQMMRASKELVQPLKEFLGIAPQDRPQQLLAFCEQVVQSIGALEELITREESPKDEADRTLNQALIGG